MCPPLLLHYVDLHCVDADQGHRQRDYLATAQTGAASFLPPHGAHPEVDRADHQKRGPTKNAGKIQPMRSNGPPCHASVPHRSGTAATNAMSTAREGTTSQLSEGDDGSLLVHSAIDFAGCGVR